MRNPPRMPIGALIVRLSSTFSSPALWIADGPSAAKTAPTSPPITAWVELDGMRTYQEKIIQRMVPLMAAYSTRGVRPCVSTTSEPTTLATATPNINGPSSWASVDSTSARRGPMAREAIIVATMLGAPKIPVSTPCVEARTSRGTMATRLFIRIQIVPIHAQRQRQKDQVDSLYVKSMLKTRVNSIGVNWAGA